MPEHNDHPTYSRPIGLAWPAGGWPFESAAATVRSLAEPLAKAEHDAGNDSVLVANTDPRDVSFKT